MNYKIKDFPGRELTVQPRLALYSVRDFTGKEMPGLSITPIDVTDVNDPTDYCDLTVSFGEFIGIKNSAYIDTNNCDFADQLLAQGIAVPIHYQTTAYARDEYHTTSFEPYRSACQRDSVRRTIPHNRASFQAYPAKSQLNGRYRA